MAICYSCFKEFDEKFGICPYCGNIYNTEPKEAIYLAPGTFLGERYFLGDVVGAGGFGVIYRAWDTKLETIVAVKEFLAARLMTRAAGEKEVIVNKKSIEEFKYRKRRFLAEAKDMAKFGAHRSIPNVFDFFEENGTAYIVMELLNGEGLNEYLQENDGKTNLDFAKYIANEVGFALISLHENGIIHCDVAPDNIYLCSGKELKIKLLDLGAAKLAETTEEVIDIILKPGYSPVEQYDTTKGIGPWTDVYALGATVYVMLTGIKPDESTNRKIFDQVIPPHELDENIPENLSNAVMKAMAVEKHLRFKNVADFLNAINGKKKVISLAKEKRKRSIKRAIGIIAACLVLCAGGIYGFNTFSTKRAEERLEPADISIWYCADEGSNEISAMESVRDDFTQIFPDVTVELKSFSESEYKQALAAAQESGTMPTMYESTGIDESIVSNGHSLENVINSDQFKSALFLNQYKNYYSDNMRMPIGIEIPVAYVITNGAECIEYSDSYYKELSDFNYSNFAVDDRHEELILANYSGISWTADKSEFFNNTENTTAVLLSSSMIMNEVRQTVINYEKTFVYPNSQKIYCNYTYEWSIYGGTEEEIAAAEKLLSWMLGNVYQSTLMISKCSDGQLPVNETCFLAKIEHGNYEPIGKIYRKFVFER